MKFLVIALFLGCIALVTCAPEDADGKIKKYRDECIAETGADEAVIVKTEDGVFEEDAKLKAFLVCYMKKPGFINDAGEYQVEILKEKLTEKYDAATAEKYIENCTKESHGNAEDNALHMAKCYYENVLKDRH